MFDYGRQLSFQLGMLCNKHYIPYVIFLVTPKFLNPIWSKVYENTLSTCIYTLFLSTLMTKLLDKNTASVQAKLAKVEKSNTTSLWRKTRGENLWGEDGIQ